MKVKLSGRRVAPRKDGTCKVGSRHMKGKKGCFQIKKSR